MIRKNTIEYEDVVESFFEKNLRDLESDFDEYEEYNEMPTRVSIRRKSMGMLFPEERASFGQVRRLNKGRTYRVYAR